MFSVASEMRFVGAEHRNIPVFVLFQEIPTYSSLWVVCYENAAFSCMYNYAHSPAVDVVCVFLSTLRMRGSVGISYSAAAHKLGSTVCDSLLYCNCVSR